MTVALHALADDLTFQDIERGEESGCTVAFIVVGHGSRAALLHRQTGLGAVQRLDLAFFIEAEDQRVLGWVEIKPDHIFELLDEAGSVGEFEGLDQMGLEAVGVPQALHRGFADPATLDHRATTPMGEMSRGPQGFVHNLRLLGARQGGPPVFYTLFFIHLTILSSLLQFMLFYPRKVSG
jgi:hypothetical protein